MQKLRPYFVTLANNKDVFKHWSPYNTRINIESAVAIEMPSEFLLPGQMDW